MKANKWVILALLIGANVCGIVMAKHIFTDGSSWAKVFSVLGAVLVNVLGLFGQPVIGAQASQGLPLPDNAGPIKLDGGQ